MRQGTGNLRRRGGFTLVELMIVLAILAVLALFSVPAYQYLIPRYRVAAAAKAVTAEMQLARMRAMSKNVPHTLTVDTSAQSIRVVENAPTGDVTVSTLTFGNTRPVTPAGPHFLGVAINRRAAGAPPDSLSGNSSAAVTFAAPGGATLYDSVAFLPNGFATRGGEVYFIPVRDLASTDNDRTFAVQVQRAGLVQRYRWRDDRDEWVRD